MAECSDDSAWGSARIAKTQALIETLEDAILQLSTGAMLSYSLDTGQTRQTVTKQQLGALRIQLDSLENRLSVLQARYCRSAQVTVRPGF